MGQESHLISACSNWREERSSGIEVNRPLYRESGAGSWEHLLLFVSRRSMMTTNGDKTTSVSGSQRQTAIFYQNVMQGGTNGAMPGKRIGSPCHRDNTGWGKTHTGHPCFAGKIWTGRARDSFSTCINKLHTIPIWSSQRKGESDKFIKKRT